MVANAKPAEPGQGGPGLRRSLKLWHLVLYGIIIIQPTAPMSIYGVVSNAARGHVVTTILLAMIAMLFTAVSYGRMARVYPSAGSAFTYVGKELHPLGGYLVGWAMLMDYVLNPVICAVWCAVALHSIFTHIPYAAWVLAIVVVFTGLNLQRVQTSARINAFLAAGMSVVVVVFLAFAFHYVATVVHPLGGAWLTPFYDPGRFSAPALFHGTSIAVLTYIGFDALSTMSEEVENPRRNIMIGTVLTCVAIGTLSAIEVYAAQLAWPTTKPFPPEMVDTAFVQVAWRVGGPFLFLLLNVTLIVANMGSGVAAQFGAARLLYGMGRDRAIPRAFFGALSPRTGIPRNNVLLLGLLTLTGCFLLSFERGAELLNFGAFIAFMGVNLAALVHYRFRSTEKVVLPLAIPLFGLLICGFIWAHLARTAQLLGAGWLAVGGLVYVLMRLRRPGTAKPLED